MVFYNFFYTLACICGVAASVGVISWIEPVWQLRRISPYPWLAVLLFAEEKDTLRNQILDEEARKHQADIDRLHAEAANERASIA